MEEDVDENDENDKLFYSQYVKRMDHQSLNETDHAKEANVSVGEQISHAPMSQFPPLPSKSLVDTPISKNTNNVKPVKQRSDKTLTNQSVNTKNDSAGCTQMQKPGSESQRDEHSSSNTV